MDTEFRDKSIINERKKVEIWDKLTNKMGPKIEKTEIIKKLWDLKKERFNTSTGRAKTIIGRREIERDWNLLKKALDKKSRDNLPGPLKKLI